MTKIKIVGLADLERCHAQAACYQFVVEKLVFGRIVLQAQHVEQR